LTIQISSFLFEKKCINFVATKYGYMENDIQKEPEESFNNATQDLAYLIGCVSQLPKSADKK